MSEHQFSEDILRTINEKHISPKPKWAFLIKDWAVWTAGVVSILIGGIAVALMITLARTDDWNILKQTSDSGFGLALMLFPYFWMAIFIGFIVIARLNLKHTKRGYRLTLPMFAGISIGLSIILGICFYDAGISQMIDSSLTSRPGSYLKLIHPRAEVWNRPMQGMLGGIVVEIPNNQTIIINDFSNQSWIVHINNQSINAERIPIHARIRCLGKQTARNEFNADQILPWGERKTILFPLPPPPDSEFFRAPGN
jgi:hypothetical protein